MKRKTTKATAFSKLKAGLEDATAYHPGTRQLTVRDAELKPPAPMGAKEVLAVRAQLRVSQAGWASTPWDSHLLDVDRVVRRMRTDEADEGDLRRVLQGDDETILVASDVEDDAVVSDEARIPVGRFDVRRRPPRRSPRLREPSTEWLLRITPRRACVSMAGSVATPPRARIPTSPRFPTASPARISPSTAGWRRRTASSPPSLAATRIAARWKATWAMGSAALRWSRPYRRLPPFVPIPSPIPGSGAPE